MEKKTQINIWYVVAAVWAVVLLQQWWSNSQAIQTIPYSEFQKLLRENQIAEIGIADNFIRGTLRSPRPNGQTKIHTLRVEPALAENLEKYGITYTGIVESKLLANLLSWVVPIAVFFGLWLFVIRRFANQSGMV